MKKTLIAFCIMMLCITTNQLIAQNLVYGQTYKVENTWMNKSAYLDVNGQGCQDNYLCVSTTRDAGRKKSNTSDWIILSASGKKVGEPVQNGDLILLKNPWMRMSYLGTRGYSKDFGCPGYLCVSAWQNLDNVKNTTWKITGDVKANGTIQLIGQWNNGTAGYLDINGHHPGGGYNVCTATDGRTKQSTSMWRFLPTAAPVKNALNAGERLNVNERLVSANGQYTFVMQTDGHIVVYKYNNGVQGAATWASGKYNFANASTARLDMQTDGNLVVYDGANRAQWSSQTHPAFNAKFSNTSNKPVKLVLENDGVLKLYNAAGAVMWSSR